MNDSLDKGFNVKSVTKAIKKEIKQMENVEYLNYAGQDGRGHPVHYLKFIMPDGSLKEEAIASSGTGSRYAVKDFMKKVRKVLQGRDGFSGANIKLKAEEDVYYHQWFNVLKRVSPYERAVAEEFASEDIEDANNAKLRQEANASIIGLKGVLKRMEDFPEEKINEGVERSFRYTLQTLLRNFWNAPKLRGKDFASMMLIVENFIENYPENETREKGMRS